MNGLLDTSCVEMLTFFLIYFGFLKEGEGADVTSGMLSNIIFNHKNHIRLFKAQSCLDMIFLLSLHVSNCITPPSFAG